MKATSWTGSESQRREQGAATHGSPPTTIGWYKLIDAAKTNEQLDATALAIYAARATIRDYESVVEYGKRKREELNE
jgi:hypothetical protein